MYKDMYEEHFSKDEQNQLKASEIREFNKISDVIGVVGLLFLFMAFLSFVSLVALVIWFGSVTLFIFIIMFVPTVIFYVSLDKLVKEYKKLIEKAKTRIKEQEKYDIKI